MLLEFEQRVFMSLPLSRLNTGVGVSNVKNIHVARPLLIDKLTENKQLLSAGKNK